MGDLRVHWRDASMRKTTRMRTSTLLPDPRFREIKELAEVCKQGNVERARELLQTHPDVLDSPDYDTRFYYPESCLWSPLGLAAWHGREELVHRAVAWRGLAKATIVAEKVGGPPHMRFGLHLHAPSCCWIER